MRYDVQLGRCEHFDALRDKPLQGALLDSDHNYHVEFGQRVD